MTQTCLWLADTDSTNSDLDPELNHDLQSSSLIQSETRRLGFSFHRGNNDNNIIKKNLIKI